jgi:glutathione S-transferase
MEFVDLETARAAPGVRIVASGGIPSPWGEGAKAVFRVKGLPFKVVRFSRNDAALVSWTGARNVPAVMYDDEPPRTGWAEILALAERLGGPPLVPADAEMRVRLHGLAHELAGENGLGWSARLLMIHGGLTTAGVRGFPPPVAQYLVPRYGYSPDRVPAARQRVLEVATLLDQQLAASHADGHRYLLGPDLTALDLYLATFFTPIVGVTEAECPALRPELHRAFAHLQHELGPEIPPALVAHRALIFAERLPGPIEI